MHIPRLSVVVMLALGALTLASCAPRVSQRVERAQAAVEQARAAGAPARVPEQFQAAEQILKESQAHLAAGDVLNTLEADSRSAVAEAMAHSAMATVKLQANVERVQAEGQAVRAQADRFQAQARADLARLQAQVGAAEEAARAARSRTERLEAEAAELKRQVAALTAPATPLATYMRYVVKRGDTLPRIAARPEIYGDAKQWPRLYEANRDIIGRDRKLKTGQVLMIPKP